MLIELTARKLAIIDDLKLCLGEGLNVLTGETGAGKSIIVGALGLAIGQRASAEWIRRGEKSAEVEAVFDLSDLPDLHAKFEEERLLEDGRLYVRRVISAGGRNRVYLGGRSMPLTRLAQIGEQIVSIFGQHETRGLLGVDNHLSILDEFAGLENDKKSYREIFTAIVDSRRKLNALREREAQSAARSDYLRFVIMEIESAQVQIGEEDQLKSRRRVLVAAEKLAQTANRILMSCEEEEDSIADQAGALARQAAEAFEIDPDFKNIAESLDTAAIAAQEAARSASEYLKKLENDSTELERIDDRLSQIQTLTRKYGGTEESILQFVDDGARELSEISSLAEDIENSQETLKGAHKKLLGAAKDLSKKRIAAAGGLSKSIQSELSDLDMKKAVFKARFDPVPADAGIDAGDMRLDADGAERAEFMLSANPGEDPKPLAKIASGGELSRIMLAIQNSLAKTFFVPSLVFDEVDSGIGGAQAQIVGRKLQSVAQHHQVLCITHLPQIAGLADTHIAVRKLVAKGRTLTTVERLDDAGREKELARMLGGVKVTDAARKAAREMMEGA